jgi:hypothetical protein
MTLPRIQELEILGFEWKPSIRANWEDRLSELADYRKINGHCNVPHNYSENTTLGKWVNNQRQQYKLHRDGKTSTLTNFRIQELEGIGFEWGRCNTAWGDRLCELANYRKIHGHCNVPHRCSENSKLAYWVANQRSNYGLHRKGKTSSMTLPRIQELESLGFEWKPSVGRKKETPKKPNPDDDATRLRETAVAAPDHVQTVAQTQEHISAREICNNKADVAFEHEESDLNGEVHLPYIPGRTVEI